MRPTLSQVRPIGNPLYTRMLVSYMNDDADYIARRCAPVVPVDEESGTYITFTKKHWFADSMKRRAYGDAYAKTGLTMGSDTYATDQWALSIPVPDELEASSQLPVRLVSVNLEFLANQSNIRKERALAAFFAASTWGTDGTPTDWDDASGDPVTDSATARRTIKQATGKRANSIAMGEIVFDAVKTNGEITDRAKYTRTLTDAEVEGLIAAILGFENLYVSRAVYNTANLGQTVSLAPIIDDDALVFVSKEGADMYDVSSLKMFTWAPGGGEGSARTYYDEDRDSTMVKSKEQWDIKQVASDTGYTFLDIV